METRILDFRFGLVDLDGVIFDPGILHRREFGRFLQSQYNISAKEALLFYQAHEDLPLEGKFSRLLTQHGRSSEEAAQAATTFRDSVAASRPIVSEGARELLELLVDREEQLFALSETESRIAIGKMEEAEVRNFFVHVIGVECAGRWDGRIARCAEMIGLPLETLATQSFVLASSPEGIATAGELGFYSVGIGRKAPEDVLRAHGAHEVFRHVALLALRLRQA